MNNQLYCKDRLLDLRVPQVMGILNVTPDSFSDGGRFVEPAAAVEQAGRMVEEGAAIIDVGGESTRPGAAAVSVQEELDRIIPVIEALVPALETVVSVDTSRPEVIRAAVAAGAGMINDVRALQLEGAPEAVAEAGVPVCVMHMQGEPRTMQHNPHYTDVVSEVCRFLADRVETCVKAGIPREHVIVDPGFGFGKTLTHNLTLLHHLKRFKELEAPLLVGLSRKSMFKALLDLPVDERLHASVAAATLACWQGADIIRVHDVLPTVHAVRLCQAAREESR